MSGSKRTWRKLACIGLGVALAAAAVAAIVTVAATSHPATDAGAAEAPGAAGSLPPFAAAPAAAPSSTLVPAAKGTWLPAAETRGQPGAAQPAATSAIRVRPSADLPPVAPAAGAPAPQMSAAPLAAASAPDPSALPPLPARNIAGPDRPAAADDPTARQSHRGVTAAAPPFRNNAAPFLRLVIPDPFEASGAMELRRVPPDLDPPFPSSIAPPKVTLPAKP